MKILIIFGVAIGLQLLLWWFRQPNKGGEVGRRVRNSDWYAWSMAVKDREQELAELKAVEPKTNS